MPGSYISLLGKIVAEIVQFQWNPRTLANGFPNPTQTRREFIILPPMVKRTTGISPVTITQTRSRHYDYPLSLRGTGPTSVKTQA